MNRIHSLAATIAAFAFIIGIIFLVACVVYRVLDGQAPKPAAPFGSSQSQFVRDSGGGVVSGYSSGDGFAINWKSQAAPYGATPLDVITVATERLRHLQKTNTGGNGYAKAIWDLEKALDSLQTPELPASSGGFIKPPEQK